MKRKITLITASSFLWLSSLQAQVPCSNDLNNFVPNKNIGSTGYYQLQNGFEEKASQTYNYNGPGKIVSVRVGGNFPANGFLAGVPLKIGIYRVDLSGKPTTQIASTNHTWWSPDNGNGYIDVTFSGGVSVNGNFAISVEVIGGFPFGDVFNLKYTGNNEGLGQDLASLAGTSTGFNWASAKNSFNKDGDFYLQPTMSNINNPSFTPSNFCNAINEPITFNNTSALTKDSMFNKIGGAQYNGGNYLYSWDFGDGSPISHAINPVHQYTTGGVFITTLTTKIEGWNNICTKTYSQSVSVGLNVSVSNLNNVSCHGGNNGSILANGHFGAPNYVYNLNNGNWQSSANFTGLTEGTYTLNIKDSKGCKSFQSFTITQPTSISFNNIITTNATCAQANGALTCNATGGLLPLQYKLNNGNYGSTGIFSNLLAGTHSLTVKDANGCIVNTSVIVNSNSGPILNQPVISNISCNNGSDGSITLSSSGGTGALTYSINNGINYQSSGVFNGLGAGVYHCIVKDNAACINITSITLTEGPALNLSVTTLPTLCFGDHNGQIDVVSNGGTGIHTYSLNGINYQSSNHFSGLAAGNYTVYVKDVTSCVKSQAIVVTEPTALAVAANPSGALCFGSESGLIAAIASGGNGNYTYSLTGENYQGIGNFENLAAGTYQLFVLDQNLCPLQTTVVINQPNAIASVVNTTNATCTTNNGSIMVVASGGSGSGYQYSNDGINFVSSGLFSGLSAGTQFIVIQDGTGCSTTVSGVVVSAGGPSILTSSSQNISCNKGNDGSINISSVSGGTGTILYSKDGIVFQTSSIFTGLKAGTYNAQVKDANGCIASVTKVLTEPNAFLVNTVVNDVNCYGDASGSIAITASGGAGFFAYSIDNGMNFQASSNFNNLTAGTYNVLIKDAANCSIISESIIQEPTQIHAYVSALNVSCHGLSDGEINISARGGLAPYTYSIDGVNYSSNGSFTQLSGNVNYTLFVQDANHCIIQIIQRVDEPSVLNVISSIQDVTCAGGNNGVIILNVTGGVAPYVYDWTNSSTATSNVNLEAGNYGVAITDFNGCSSTSSFVVTEPNSPIVVNGTVLPSTDNASANGSIDVTVTGGTSPYNFNWSTTALTEDLTSLNPGAYMLTITDASGCAISSTFVVPNLLGIDMIEFGNNIQLYPNPTSSFVTINANDQTIYEITLLNTLGEELLNVNVNATSYLLQIDEYTDGIYLMKINLGTKSYVKRLEIKK